MIKQIYLCLHSGGEVQTLGKMRCKFFIVLFSVIWIVNSFGQKKYVLHESKTKIECTVYDFNHYKLIDIKNLDKSDIYIPEDFYIKNDCDFMECYISNSITDHPFVEEYIKVKTIKSNENYGFIVNDDITMDSMKVYLSFSKKKIESDEMLNLVDDLEHILISKSN